MRSLESRISRLEQAAPSRRKLDDKTIAFLESLSRDERDQLELWIEKIHFSEMGDADKQEFEKIWGIPFDPSWRPTDPAVLAELSK